MLALLFVATLVGLLPTGSAYCNGMHYGPRSPSDHEFVPGWNGLAATPPRGWRSWYAYYTRMNQPMIQDAIDALAARNRTVAGWEGKVSLCDLGYCTAGIDEGWEGCGLGVNGTQHFLNGTPAVNPTLFPDMKGLVDYGHSKGLKMGWYLNGCGCIEKREPASGWDIDYRGDMDQLAAFGFDAVKYDGCGRLCNMTLYAELAKATGRSYVTENCHWGFCTEDDASSCPTQDWCPWNLFRVSGDSDNGLGTWYRNLQATIRFQDWATPVSQPGCWAYPDMLQVGRLGCGSHTSGCPVPPNMLPWTRAHFAAFAIVSSPLVLSIHPSDANLEPILDIIGNKRAMEVNQAWAGHPGSLLRTLPPAEPPPPPVRPGNATCGVARNATDGTQRGWAYSLQSGRILRGGFCLSTDGLDLPVRLAACGSPTTYQNFTYDPVRKAFHIMVPANHPTPLYPGCLQDAGGAPQAKVDVFHCNNRAANQQWDLDAAAGTLCTGNTCLAARDHYYPPPAAVAGVQWWSKPLGGGRVAALLINGGSLPYPDANVSMAELNVTGPVRAIDVWTGADAGPVDAEGVWRTGPVPPMDSSFVIFGPAPGDPDTEHDAAG